MMFEPGTPLSVIKKAEKEWLNKQNGQGTVPSKPKPEQGKVPLPLPLPIRPERPMTPDIEPPIQIQELKPPKPERPTEPNIQLPKPTETPKPTVPPSRPPIVRPMPPRPAPTKVQLERPTPQQPVFPTPPKLAPTSSLRKFKEGGYVSNDGKINLGSCRVSTAVKNKKNSNW